MKNWLKNILFREDISELAEKQEIINKAARKLAGELDAFEIQKDTYRNEVRKTIREEMKTSVDVVDLVREKLVGFNPKLVDGTKLVMSNGGTIDVVSSIFDDAKIAGYASDMDFLADCKSLLNTKALPVICDYIRRNQIIFTTGAAKTMEQVNFGGASINGVELVREEVQRMKAIFDERNEKPEDFDKHEAV